MLEKFKKHIGEPITVKIGGEEFQFKPLTLRQVKDCLVAATLISNQQTKPAIEQGYELYFKVLKEVIKASYPELDNDTVEKFIAANTVELIRVIPKLAGFPEFEEDVKKLFGK